MVPKISDLLLSDHNLLQSNDNFFFLLIYSTRIKRCELYNYIKFRQIEIVNINLLDTFNIYLVRTVNYQLFYILHNLKSGINLPTIF